jgi:hypothetical protein
MAAPPPANFKLSHYQFIGSTVGRSGVKARDMVHVASIPPAIVMEWLVKYGVRAWDRNHAAAVKRLLNDGEYRYLRVNNLII